ncbi:MAG: DUF1796 family putative cysteine peptidase [Nitrosomonadaceae bacterium]
MKYFVPLGSDCVVAMFLRDNNIRRLAFPFDWSVTPMQSVLHLFENNFEDFLKDENLMFLPQATRAMVLDDDDQGVLTNDVITPCYDKKYHMLLPHDFSKQGEADLSQVQAKYKKRISRMYDLLNDSNNNFTFIAGDRPTNPKSWRAQQFDLASGKPFINDYKDWKNRFTEVIKNKFPNLKYSLYDFAEFKKTI